MFGPEPHGLTKLSHRKLSHLTEIAHAGLMGEMVVDVVSKGLTPKDAAAKAEAKVAQLLKELDTKKG